MKATNVFNRMVHDKREETMIEDTIEQRFEVGDQSALTLRNAAGRITVAAGDGSLIQVRATKQGSLHARQNTHVEMSQDGNSVRVETKTDGHGCAVEYDVTTPADCRVSLHSASGEIQVSGHHAPLEVRSASGRVLAADIVGNAEIHTASGGIEVRNLIGSLTLDSASGSGKILNSTLPNFELHTASGNLLVETGLNSSGRYTAHTASGSLTLSVPPETKASISMHTASGSLSSEVPAQVSRIARGEWTADIGGGGVHVEASTASGNVRIVRGADRVQTANVAGGDFGPVPGSSSTQSQRAQQPEATQILKSLERGELSVDEAMAQIEEVI